MAGTCVQAEEGFSDGSQLLPGALQRAWNGTFLLHGKGHGGTAFLIKVQRQGSESKLYLLTNKHVVSEQCGSSKNCNESKIVYDVGLEYQTPDSIFDPNAVVSGAVKWISYGYNLFLIKDPKVEVLSHDADLAIISVTAPAKLVDTIQPLDFRNDCSTVRLGDEVYS